MVEEIYRVAICDDERHALEELCVLCREILSQHEVVHEITPFISANDLAAAMESGSQFDLLCLDIIMNEKTGMEFATELRKWDEQTSILFITCTTGYLLEGYSVRPIQYLLKPVKREELEKAIQTDLRLKHQARTVTLDTKGGTAVLNLADIRYVESRNHGCMFFINQEERFFQLSLTQAETLLPQRQFSRCHNSFLVNLAQIKELAGREIVLLDGSRLAIGRRYAEQFRSDFVRYLNQNSR